MKLQKLDDPLLNLIVVFEGRRIKGVSPLQASDAVKQLVICIRHGEISALILITYHYPWLQREQCGQTLFAHSIFKAIELFKRGVPWNPRHPL